MGQIITTLYVYFKSICPPCITYYTIDLSSYDLSANNSPNNSPNDLSANYLSANDVSSNNSTYDISSNIVIPKQSLDDILKNKYHIPHKKAVCLMEEFHTLQAIMNLTVEQICECKCNERKIGAMGETIWKQLHK